MGMVEQVSANENLHSLCPLCLWNQLLTYPFMHVPVLVSYIRTIIQRSKFMELSSSQVQLREVELEYHVTAGIQFPWT